MRVKFIALKLSHLKKDASSSLKFEASKHIIAWIAGKQEKLKEEKVISINYFEL